MPEISVVILTYNSALYIEKLLKSLNSRYEKEIKDGEIEIIVADNQSSDETFNLVSKIDNIKFVKNGGNFGFAKGINLGSSHAKGKYLLFINPDAVFLKGDLFNLIKNIDSSIGAVGGEIINLDGKRELSCGKFYNLINVVLLALGLEEKLGIRFAPQGLRSVDFISGGFFMISRELFGEMGGFDENLFMYVEDMELCFRLKKKKLKVLFSSDATIQHVGQGSSNRSFAIKNIYKGLLYFHKKHKGLLSYNLVKITLLLKAVSLVMLGRISNNKYLYSTYKQALEVL